MIDMLLTPALGAILRPEIMVFLIPITAIVLGIGSAIIKQLTDHQRKMAELIHANRQADPELLSEIRALRGEISEMRDRVNGLVINSDSFDRSLLQTPASPPPVPDRQQQIGQDRQ